MKWDRLLGVSLAGEYPLEEILGEGESGAWFQTFSEARNSRAVLEAMEEASSAGEYQLACWRRVRLLSHPHLQLLYDCGRTSHHGESLLYAVFENPDDSLDAALTQGSLEESEVRDVQDAVGDALRYLHSHGLVHAAVDARHIIAVGNFVKITTDTVRPGSPEEAEGDLRALREALGFRTATAEPPPPAVDPAIAQEPEPAAEIGEAVVAAPVLATPAVTTHVLPAALSHPLRDRESEPEPTRRSRRTQPFWAYAAAAAALVAIVVAITHKPPTESAAAPAVSAPAAAVLKTAPPVVPSESRPPLIASRNPAPPASPTPSVAHRSVEPARARGEWRVIAYTYLRLKDAENKARSINQKLPGLNAEVYTPKGRNQPPFLVALGGRMTRTDAAGVQRKALSRGLPRDTFIRNYND